MKYGKLAWVTTQGIALIVVLAYGLSVVKQRYVEGSHAMSNGIFDLILVGVLGAAVGFAQQRAMKELRRLQRGEESR